MSGSPPSRSQVGRLAVFGPSPLLTVTIEPGADRPEVHLHAGGQGFWVARLVWMKEGKAVMEESFRIYVDG